MMKFFLVLISTVSVAQIISAQDVTESKIKAKIYGYAAWEVFSDSRKSREARDGDLYFYPNNVSLDINGRDVNAVRSFTMLALSSRLGYKVEGFEAFGAKGMSMVEADFWGTNQDNINLLRIRHALVKLSWERTQLMTGMYWHPVIVDEMIPGNVSFGAGAPFHALNRAPQVRLSYMLTQNIKLTGAAIVNAYHRSAGAYDAQRNSGKPELFGQISGSFEKSFLFGVSASYKWLRPRIEIALLAPAKLKTDKELGSFYTHAFGLMKVENFTLKLEGVYGQELSFLNMIGGYGKITGTDGLLSDYDYTNLNTLSVWFDASYQINKFNVGFFAGRQSLHGADDNYSSTEYKELGVVKIPGSATNDDLSHIYRLSPRIFYSVDKLTFGFEYMLTGAVYGKAWDANHVVTETADPVVNHRLLFLTKYTF
jgi:hypothetical protein